MPTANNEHAETEHAVTYPFFRVDDSFLLMGKHFVKLTSCVHPFLDYFFENKAYTSTSSIMCVREVLYF